MRFAKEKRNRLKALAERIRSAAGRNRSVNPLFIEEAADLLVEARPALTYSYPYNYFLIDYQKLKLCEFFQSELQQHIELLDNKTDINETSIFINN